MGPGKAEEKAPVVAWWIEFENGGHSTACASEAGGMGGADGLPNLAIANELATPTGISSSSVGVRRAIPMKS